MNNFQTKIGNPLLLGATKKYSGVNFAVIVENAVSCPVLRIYEKGTYNVMCDISFDVRMRFGDIFAMEIYNFDCEAFDYGYMYENEPYPDIYGKVVNHRDKWGVKALPTYRIFEDTFDWGEENKEEIPFHEAVMYRLHVRGFTAHKTSGTKYRGTYKGIVDKIPYLKELGVNVIELMPAYDFNEVSSAFPIENKESNCVNLNNPFEDKSVSQSKVNYWGYTTASYFAPKSAYAYGGAEGAATEFKEMVKAIHDAGMEIVMEFHFMDGMKPHVVMDCIRYWVMEYHIDGVHANLNVVPVNMIKTDPLLSRIKILGDRWELINDYYMPSKGNKHFAICNDGFMCTARKFLKSDEGQAYDMSNKIKENPKDAGIVNYLSTHNSFTLMDTVCYDRKHNEENGENNLDGSDLNYSWNCGVEGPTRKKKVVELRKQQLRNAVTLLFVSQGIPMITAGDEMGRTCRGNNNPYCHDNEINHINWNDLKKNSDIYEFTKYMINFRREHKILHMKDELRMMDYKSMGCPDLSVHGIEPWRPDFNYVSRSFGMLYNESYAGTVRGKLYIMFNMYWENQEFNMPAASVGAKWKMLIQTADKDIRESVIDGRKVNVPPRSISIICEV